ncbi:pyridoxamine 5'-phosphate oxidase [Lacibacterium aquatile]|uniref:Pyridoxine/pyridoxamine 5'-phosphate oxidase n=1 Tax=Lacibacterium aquatile TaxID=1168082 RepID=A0ABW5DKV1_9PROT
MSIDTGGTTRTDPIPDVADPYALFADWFAEAKTKEINDPNAMYLATSTPDGFPSSRAVLMKDYDPRGFVFYTNYESRKGGELLSNPRCALLFHWKTMERQVRVEGTAIPVMPEEADAYYASRPYGSRIGAWASSQSRPLDGRDTLVKRVAEVEAEYPSETVPRPPHWSGFRVTPVRIEFWQAMPFRLHDRIVYSAVDGGGWTTGRLYP